MLDEAWTSSSLLSSSDSIALRFLDAAALVLVEAAFGLGFAGAASFLVALGFAVVDAALVLAGAFATGDFFDCCII